MAIGARSVRNQTCDRNEDCLIVAMRVANPLLRVLSMVQHPCEQTGFELQKINIE